MAAGAQDDLFDFKSNSSSEDECFQAWSSNKTVVANLNPTLYNPVVETVKKPRPDLKERKCYLSPKEKADGKMSFMERMRERNSKQPRVITDLGTSSSSKSKHKSTSKEDNNNPFENIKCSSAMKRFILSEFRREKVACNFLPEKQVAMAIIHRYKSYIASSSSNCKGVSPSSKHIIKDKQSLKLGGKKSRTKKIGKKAAASVGDSGFLEDSDNEQLDIVEYDENNLPIPEEGTFTLNPTPAQIKFQQQVLVRYNSDNDTDDISDCSSPVKIPENIVKKQELVLRNVKMCGPALPCLASTSLDQPGETSVDWESYGTHEEVAQDVVNEVCGGAACGWCLKCPRPAVLQLCSACSSVAYCGAGCQGESWPTHKKICKKLKGASWDVKVMLVHEMIEMAKTRGLKRRLKAQASSSEMGPQTSNKRSRRSVQFNSQPEFEPSQGKAVVEQEVIKMETNNPKSILKRCTVKLQTVLYSPPVKSLAQHLITVREGTQEERFKEIKSQAVESGSALKRQSSEKLRSKLSEMKNVKLNLNEKLEDSRTNSDLKSSEFRVRVLSPSKSLLRSTPVSSPSLVEEIKTLSSSRPHTSRVLSRRHESTPYPRSVDLDSDQELSLTPTESVNAEVSTGVDFKIPRRLDFDAQDDDDDKELEQSSQLLDEYCKISEDGGGNKESPSASQDMFNSPNTDGNNIDGSVADDCENVSASAINDTESENEESSAEDDYDIVDAHPGELCCRAESSNSNENMKLAVMIPESSSDSSLAEFSPDMGLFGQSQGEAENEDGLAGMFSDNEENEVKDESEQEEDLLAVI